MSFLKRNQIVINIFLPIMLTGCIFYSGNLGERISEIETNYIIDTNTLNNSFITLAVNASIEDDESFEKVRKSLGIQMEQFNKKYEMEEKERIDKKSLKAFVDKLIYLFLLLQIIFNAMLLNKNKMVVLDIER